MSLTAQQQGILLQTTERLRAYQELIRLCKKFKHLCADKDHTKEQLWDLLTFIHADVESAVHHLTLLCQSPEESGKKKSKKK